jgi:hypothetical protein
MIGNPLKSVPRYAKLLNNGLRGEVPFIPDVGSGGMADAFLYNQALGVREKPLMYAAGTLGGYALNQAVGNPVGGFIDAATFGMTNLKPDEIDLIAAQPRQVVINQQPVSLQSQPSMQPQTMARNAPPGSIPVDTFASVPALGPEEMKKQREYLQRKIATDLLTVQALQQPTQEYY